MNRNIAICVILSIITCGIYAIYWMYVVNEELNELSNEQGQSGLAVILLSLVTCGIYTIYWAYTMGEKADKVKNSQSSLGAICLILTLFTTFVVPLCILQDAINKVRN